MKGRRIAVDIGEIFVRELGQVHRGDLPVLAVHGGPDWDHHYLLPGLIPLSERRPVLAMDLRGCGASSRGLPIGSCQPVEAVRDLLTVVDAYGLDRVDLLGFSYGGRLVQLFAESYPDRVRSLVLASTSAYDGKRQEAYQRRSDAWRARSQLCPEREWPESSTGDLASLTRQWAFEQVPVDVWDEDLFISYRMLLESVDFSGDWLAEAVSRGLDPSCPEDAPSVLARLNLPTLVLHGEFDLTFPVQLALDLIDDVPLAQLALIPGAGHMAQFERPDEWAAAIGQFLS